MVLKSHDKEVELILDDIRDSLAPNRNPDCTFTTRRQDKRLQERLIELSEKKEESWAALVVSRTQDLTAIGWENIRPYPRYIEKRAPAKESGLKKGCRQTQPVDNSTLVRHLQERIRKWADRKPASCVYRRKAYSNLQHSRGLDNGASPQVVSAMELPVSNPELDPPGPRRSLSNESSTGGGGGEKLPVTWSILSQNDATHMNMSVYGVDPHVTYVPARRISSHLTSYTSHKQVEQQQKKAGGRLGTGGVLHPAKTPRYITKRSTGGRPAANKVTVDYTEEEMDQTAGAGARGATAGVRYNDKFRCSICIEGLQVADPEPTVHSLLPPMQHTLPEQVLTFNWPTHIEYSAGNSGVPVKAPSTTSSCLATYKSEKRDSSSSTAPTTSLAVLSKQQPRATAPPAPGSLYQGPVAKSLYKAPAPGLLDPTSLQVVRKGAGGEGGEARVQRKGRFVKEHTGALSLYDRYQAASRSGGKGGTKNARPRPMYGVSICDAYDGGAPQDAFSYGLFLSGAVTSPPATKHKLDPLISITPAGNGKNLRGH